MTRNTPTAADNDDPWEQIEADLFGVEVGKEHTAAERVAEEPIAEEDAPPDMAIAKPLEEDDFSDFSDFGAGLIEDEPSPPPRKVAPKPAAKAKPAPVSHTSDADTPVAANVTEYAEPASLPDADDEAPSSAASENEKEDPYWDALANWNWQEEGGKPKSRHKETPPVTAEQPAGEEASDSDSDREETGRSSRRRERRRGRREDVLPDELQTPVPAPVPEPEVVAEASEPELGWPDSEEEEVETTANIVDEETPSFDSDEDAESEEAVEGDDGPRRKRRRRRRRRPGDRSSAPIAEESNDADVRALPEDEAQESLGFDEEGDTGELDSEPAEEQRPARRRGRGPRGSSRRERGRPERAPAAKPAPAAEFDFSDEDDDFEEPSFEFTDENEDEEEYEEQPPARSRRGRLAPSRAAVTKREEEEDEDDGEPDPSISFEDVPTWEEAISYLLNPTLVEGGTPAPSRGRPPERPERSERSERPPRSYRGSSRGGERSSSAERPQERSEERPAPRQERPPQQRSQERPPRASGGDRPAPRRRPPAPPSRGDDFESF